MHGFVSCAHVRLWCIRLYPLRGITLFNDLPGKGYCDGGEGWERRCKKQKKGQGKGR